MSRLGWVNGVVLWKTNKATLLAALLDCPSLGSATGQVASFFSR